MTEYKIVSITTETSDRFGHRSPERIEAHVQVGKAAKLADVELTRQDAWRLVDQLLTAIRRNDAWIRGE